jgi:predicted RNase H-like HicB family nuclease
MAQQVYTIELHPADPDEGDGFWVSVPALPGCFTQGKTYDEAVFRAQEAIECHLDALAISGQPIPADSRQPTILGVSVALPQIA